MKTTTSFENFLPCAIAESCQSPRFQIYREIQGGDFVPNCSGDSDAEIIEEFMRQVPAFEGANVRILDRNEKQIIAFLKWKVIRTEIGLSILQRINVFRDRHHASIACAFLREKEIRAALEELF